MLKPFNAWRTWPTLFKIIDVDRDQLFPFPFLLMTYVDDDDGVRNDHPFNVVGEKVVPEEVAVAMVAMAMVAMYKHLLY